MTAAFPTWINFQPQQNGYGEARESNRAEFKPSVGPPKRRRRATVSNVVLKVSGWLKSSYWDDLDSFYYDTVEDGTLPFTWTHPRTGQTGTFQFEGDAPNVARTQGKYYLIQFAVRTLSLTGIPPALQFDHPRNSQYLGAL